MIRTARHRIGEGDTPYSAGASVLEHKHTWEARTGDKLSTFAADIRSNAFARVDMDDVEAECASLRDFELHSCEHGESATSGRTALTFWSPLSHWELHCFSSPPLEVFKSKTLSVSADLILSGVSKPMAGRKSYGLSAC